MSMKITHAEIKMISQREVPYYILGNLMIQNKNISHIIPQTGIRLETSPIEVSATPKYQALLDDLKNKDKDKDKDVADIYLQIDLIPEIDRYQVKINDPDFYFVKFLRDVSRLHWRKELEAGEPLTPDEQKEQDLTLANHLFVIGYLCSEFKDKGRPWVVLTMDNKISEVGTASGRSGKSLIADGLKYVRPMFKIGGRNLDQAESFKFIYDGLTEFHNLIEIDDFAEYGLFQRLYTEITGAREINPKNYARLTLEYAESGKMVISTNYELQSASSSTRARILYQTVSDYYHEISDENDYRETRKPDLKFGRKLYDDFSSEEWNKFFNLIAYCIQLQMRFYKINPPTANIHKRELRREMQKNIGKTDEFLRFANSYFVPKPDDFVGDVSPTDGEAYLDCYINKKAAFDNLYQILSVKQRGDYRIQKFKDHIELWCKYYGYKFNPESLINDKRSNRIIRRGDDGKSEEFFYISTGRSVAPATDNKIEPVPDFAGKNNNTEMPF
jgi:hypothetical protein